MRFVCERVSDSEAVLCVERVHDSEASGFGGCGTKTKVLVTARATADVGDHRHAEAREAVDAYDRGQKGQSRDERGQKGQSRDRSQ